MMTTATRPAYSERCKREATRDVVFLLQSRNLQWLEIPDGYEGDDESEMQYVLPSDTPYYLREEKQDDWLSADDVFKKRLTFCTSLGDVPCVIEEWKIEGVWLSREEAEEFAKSHAYRFRHGWRVYGVCSDGELAELIKAT